MAFVSTSFAVLAVAFAPNLVPAPVSLTVATNVPVRLDAAQTVSVACGAESEAAAKWARAHLAAWLGVAKGEDGRPNIPKVSVSPLSDPVEGGDEAYELDARPKGIQVRANTLQGVRYALYTLRQTVYAEPRTGRRVGWHVMPAMKVKDSPKLAFRGIHIPWTLNQTPQEIEKRLRVAAFLKYNVAVIEPWGTYRSAVHPWWGWEEGTMTPQDVRHLAEVGKDLGIMIVPQFPAFGHATMSICSTGKHAALDAHPEYQTLFEGLNGWNWCLSNPEVLKVQFEIIDEMLEAFGHPKYFHIGCDEAVKPNCPECLASDYRQLVINHILSLYRGLKERGVQTMLWHDMFLKHRDPRWKGFYANGTDETVKAFESFPRDIIVCDWYYEKAREDGRYPTLEHFKEMGFPVLTSPGYEISGTEIQCRRAIELGLLGTLQTTWKRGSGKEIGRYMAGMYAGGAAAAWGSKYTINPLTKWKYDFDYVKIVRFAVWDMGLKAYADTGIHSDKNPPAR